SRRRHTRFSRDWSSDVCSSDLDIEEGARPFRVGGGDHRSVDVQKAAFLKKIVDRATERVAHAKDGVEGVRARSQVGDLAQKLEEIGRASCREKGRARGGRG